MNGPLPAAAAADEARLPGPALLMQLALAYRTSAVLFAALDVDVFSRLAAGPKTAAELAGATGAHEPGSLGGPCPQRASAAVSG
jgi:hypothetical protein